MGVYIKGMSKELCKMLLNVGDDYEIIEVKEPHGRLVDIDKLPFWDNVILNAETVIEAEGE